MGKKLIVTLAFALAFAGCGGGADVDTTVTSKADFVEKVNAACDEELNPIASEYNTYVNEIGATKAEASKEGLPEAQRQKMHELLDHATRVELEVIGEFDPPDGGEDRIEAILESIEKALEEGEGDPDITAAETAAFEKARALADAYRLEVCHL